MNPRHRRAARALASAVTVATGLLLLTAAPALAASTRNFDTQLTGQTPPGAPVSGPFEEPFALAMDGHDNVWVADRGAGRSGVISEYDSSGGYLSQQTGGGHWPDRNGDDRFPDESIALNNSTGYLYVGVGEYNEAPPNSGVAIYAKPALDVFDNTGAFSTQFRHSFFTQPSLAVDNSGVPGQQGRFYVTSEIGGVQAFEPDSAEHDFSPEPYIAGNEITGPPGGSFGVVADIATDTHGNIYLADPRKASSTSSTPAANSSRNSPARASAPSASPSTPPTKTSLSSAPAPSTNSLPPAASSAKSPAPRRANPSASSAVASPSTPKATSMSAKTVKTASISSTSSFPSASPSPKPPLAKPPGSNVPRPPSTLTPKNRPPAAKSPNASSNTSPPPNTSLPKTTPTLKAPPPPPPPA